MPRFVAVALVLGLLGCVAQAQAGSLAVEGTEFVLKSGDGRILRSRDLAGATLSVDLRLPDLPGNGTVAEILIEAVTLDPKDQDREVWLHTLKIRRQETGTFADFCEPDPDGHRYAFPLAVANDGWTLTCTAGAQGKCVRLGYRPWRTDNGVRHADYHRACVHLLRADYCGDDQPTTRNGTLINIWDLRGTQKRDVGGEMTKLTFEAAFGPQGAVCLSRVRVPQDVSLASVIGHCSRLAAVPTGAACTEDLARGLADALIFVDSDPAGPFSARPSVD